MPTVGIQPHIGEPTAEGYRDVTLSTVAGDVICQWYRSPGSERAIAYVGGVGGDFDSPANGLYPRLCSELLAEGFHGLRVQFRDPVDLVQAIYDLEVGTAFLAHEGAKRVGIVGHSFGGAVAIQVAALDEHVRTVVALASQSHGARPVADLRPGVSALLMHGAEDTALPPTASEHIFDWAHEPKRLVILPGTGHVLDESAEQVHAEVREWLERELPPEPRGASPTERTSAPRARRAGGGY